MFANLTIRTNDEFVDLASLPSTDIQNGIISWIQTFLFGEYGTRRRLPSDKEITMRFMMLVKTAENSGPPPKELMDAIAELAEEAVKNRTMIESGGLAPTAASTRVRVSRGQVTTIDGPFTEAKEVVGGY